MRVALLFACSTLCACADVGVGGVEIPLYVAGVESSATIAAVGGVDVDVDRVDLAFGPLYLCAGDQAGKLCDTAKLEWLESIVVDTTDPEPQRAGVLHGSSGAVRSWMYDLGLTSILTQSQPLVSEAAHELDGSSLVIEGTARVGMQTLAFVASIPIRQETETEPGIPVVRKSSSEVFEHVVGDETQALLVRFDYAPWIRGVDFTGYVQDVGCNGDGAKVVCALQIEQTCDDQGQVVATRDCAVDGAFCQADVGCREQLVIEPGTQAFRSIRNAVVSGERPMFTWNFEP